MQSISFKTGIAGSNRGLYSALWISRFLRFVSVVALVSLAASAQSQELPEVPELSDVLAEKRFEIQQKCLPSFHRDGDAEYINCVRTNIANEKTDSALLLDRFSFDDKYALQQSCSEYYGRNEVYTECLKSEITKLDSIPEPNLSTLNEDELNALQQNCFEDQKSRGAPAYRTCLSQALGRMLEIPRVDLSGLSSIDVNEMKLFCINSSRQLKNANYRLCLAEALAAKLKLQQNNNNSVVTATIPTEAIPAAAVGTNESASISANQTQPSVIPTTLTDAETTVAAGVTTGEPLNDNGASFLTSLSEDPVGALRSIDIRQYSKHLIFILPLIILLICFKLLRMLRRKRSEEYYSGQTRGNAKGQPKLRTDLYNDPAFGSSRGSSASKQARSEELHDHRLDFLHENVEPTPENEPPSSASAQTSEATTAQSADTATGAAIDTAADEYPEPAPNASEPVSYAANRGADPVYELSEFSHWIASKPVPEIKRLCTEFMLYWISFGEGNYSQNLKNHLLHTQDLNEHDQIKKWVLEQNPSAFVDLLKQLREIFSPEEIRQTIKLMMAVLIKREISPVQNTFLRFLADFTNIGSEWLDEEYQASFGQKLPPLPRPDDERWWQRISEATAVTQGFEDEGKEDDDRILCLRQLGLNEPASGEDIANAYHRIALRCHPERFDQLGEKERNVALRFFDRCSEAHNFLLELEK